MLKKALYLVLFMQAVCLSGISQNLLTNPGAESLPAGTGWTILSSGGTACAVGTAANSYLNWTMTPDNSTNYPAAHGGIKTFFSGCSVTVPGGPFELYQDIDVSADALVIDAGSVTYVFAGFIQSPISPQGDAGRFIVDYLNSGGTVLGTSYVSVYQSFSSGSGTAWNSYTNTRLAPSGTRKVRVRLQSTVTTGPAINAYFDDLSLTKTVTLPVVLESFKGSLQNDLVALNWLISDAVNFSEFQVEKSADGMLFMPITTVKYSAGQLEYTYNDKLTATDSRLFYRLKMIDIDNRYVYSATIAFNRSILQPFEVSPNPASTYIIVTGLHCKGSIVIAGMGGGKVFESAVTNSILLINIAFLGKGMYVITYQESGHSQSKKLILQ